MKAGNWLPGSAQPAWIPEDTVGTFGFDPLGLAKDKAALERFQEAEVIHCRWAMLGIAGAIGVEVLGYGNWYDAPVWALNGGKATYFGAEVPFDLTTITLVEIIGFAIAEGARADAEKSKKIYPGFDPAGLAKDPAAFEKLKLNEIKNGRLAMVAFVGLIGQHAANGKTPLEALSAHLANPWANNFATNGVSVPGL
jgi:light-harvesting complex I chlorophyll a/b binding protein 1